MKTLTLKRISDDGVQTLGTLIDENGLFCDTLERPWKNNKSNVSCIPKGTYLCKWTFSPLFAKYTFQVMNVPGRSGIRIHKGNYWYDIQGCILLGKNYSDINKDGKVDIINSTITIKKFEDLMKKEPFTLIIQ